MLGGGVVGGKLVCLHEVHARQVLVGKEDVREVLSGYVQELWQACTRRHVESVEALLAQKLLGVGQAAHDAVVLKLHAKVLKAVDLAPDDLLGKAKLWNAVDEHAPAREERLKYGDVKAVAGKLPCAGDTGGARADDGHAPAVLGGDLRGAG